MPCRSRRAGGNREADFETSDPFFHFGRPFGWALLSVWLVHDASGRPGSAERLACGIVRGFIEPPSEAFTVPAETIVSVMVNALILIRQAQHLAP